MPDKTRFDIAFSLNRQIDITEKTWEDAKAKLKETLRAEGINASYEDDEDAEKSDYIIEVFDSNEFDPDTGEEI